MLQHYPKIVSPPGLIHFLEGLALLMLFNGNVFAQPANNDCADATNLTVGSTCTPISDTTVGATQSIPSITCAGFIGAADDDVWYKFTATATTATIIVAGTSPFDAVVDLRSGSCNGTNIACADATFSGGTETINATGLVVGNTYLIRVYNYGAGGGTFTICVSSAPAYNPCASITNISACGISVTSAATGTGAYSSISASCSFSTPGQEKIYTFTPTVTGTYQIQITSVSNTSFVDYFYKPASGGCSGTGYTCISGRNATGTFGSFTLTAGTQYYILTDPEATTATSQTFNVVCPAPPANDECSGAVTLTQSAYTTCTSTAGTTVNSTASGITGCAGNPDDDVWYKFVANSTTATITVNGTLDAVVNLRSGTCPGTSVSCVNVTSTGTETMNATGLVSGQTYLVRVYSFPGGSGTGTFTICVTGTTPQPSATQEWLQRYDFGGTSDIAIGLVADSAGNVYVTGYGGPLGNTDIITNKYSAAGQLIWTKVWNGPGNSYDAANAIILRGNAIYITGYTEYTPLITSNRKRDFATLKYDLNGVLHWSAFYNFSNIANWEDIAYAIDVDPQSNVYVTGSSKSASAQVGYRDIATIKYNANGIEQWVVRYNAFNGTDDDIPVALRVDQQSNVYVTGRSVGASTGWDYVTLKYSSAGVNLWTKRYTMPGNSADLPYALKLDANGNVYVTGASSGYNVDPGLWYDYATIKYNTNGDTLWVKRFNSGSTSVPWDEARDLAVDESGNVYVTGFVPSTTTTGDDIYTIKYNESGTLIWQSRYDSPFGFEDHPNKMKLDQEGNIYITGHSKSDGSTAGNDYITLKLNNSGQLQWDERYDGPNHSIDNAYDLVLNNNHVYVTGQSYGFSDDYVTIKYAQPSTGCSGPPTVTINASGPTTFCTGGSVSLSSVVTESPVTYQWKKNGVIIGGATSASYSAAQSGSYSVTATNDCGSTTSNAIAVTVNKLPKAIVTPSGTVTMCQGSSTLLSANTGAALTYQWKKGNVNIAGATNSTYTATSGGKYKVVVTNSNTGCSKTSPFTTINITCKEIGIENESLIFALYPNPTSNEFALGFNDGETYDLMIYDLLGKEVEKLTNVSNSLRFGSQLEDGVYFAQVIKNGIPIHTLKLIKQQ